MKMRLTVILTLIVCVVPIAAMISAYRLNSIRAHDFERRAERTLNKMSPRFSEHCDRPHIRPRGPFGVYTYDSGFSPYQADAPIFPESLENELAHDDIDIAHESYFLNRDDRFGATAAEFIDGHCDYVMLVWRRPPGGPPGGGALKRIILEVGFLSAMLVIVGFVVSFPIVRRVRRLERGVREAPQNGFDRNQFSGRDELGDLANAFGETFDRLEARDAALKTYVSNTTHDLAIPVTVLQHRLRRLAKDVDGAAAETVKSALEESHYIAGLIANMGASAKLESPNLTRIETDLGALVERVVARHRPIAEQRSVDFNIAIPLEPLVMNVDAVLVEQAVSNITQNAVQYLGDGSEVSVVLERVGSGFELRVIDDGPGVPATLKQRIFERSVRGDDARNRNAGGQGFGLAIAKRVVDLHGWTIHVESSEEGATFIIRCERSD